jgi:hypothetical protein
MLAVLTVVATVGTMADAMARRLAA